MAFSKTLDKTHNKDTCLITLSTAQSFYTMYTNTAGPIIQLLVNQVFTHEVISSNCEYSE